MTATMSMHTTLRGLFFDVSSRPSGLPRSSRSGVSERVSLLEDQRGAVMLTGLFMACFLIGALWFVIGIGDAIVFRDKMQEAADSGAFSSAALHAKGMNFISLCNLVMLVGTVIHIVLGIISDVKFARAIYICIYTLGIGCIPAIADFESAYRRWDNYFSMMSKGFKAIHIAQKTASYAYPALGVVESYKNGAKYGNDRRTSKVTVLAASSSILPGAAARGLGATKVTKEGLPVEAKKFSDLCKKVVSVAANGVVNLLGLGKSVSGTSLGGKALSIFNSIVGAVLEFRYCNKTNMHFEPFGPGFDSFWGEDGPYVVYSPASNGNVWMQTWAINIAPKLNDTSESRVGLAAKRYSKYTTQEGSPAYFAQAEFYFDCDSKWSTAACNFEDNATYAIKWRARMRRLELPALTSALTGGALAAILKLDAISDFKKAIPDAINDMLGNSGAGRAAMKGLIDNLVGQLQGVLTKPIKDAAGNYDPTLSGFGMTSYH
ncbi:MAG: hypothetical protein BGO98_11805 [Myxococcales bacterium 68-20]|nr:MAG: hypothetical protein BGO98_11805 [Myxococcales bacterium 68-20]